MGIHRFLSGWLDRQKFSFYEDLSEVASLFLDFNSILHISLNQYSKTVGQDVQLESIPVDYFHFLFQQVASLIDSLNPKLLVVSVDGVSPQAKICHQRQKRYLYPSKAEITPGTDFMKALDFHIKEWILTLPVEKIIYSSSLVPGEGEHKIIDIIKNERLPPGNHLIHSPDSDMIILASLTKIPNIYINRDKGYFSISAFQNFLSSLAITPPDFSVVLSFFGNDYFPRPVSLTTIEIALPKLISMYQDLHTPLVVDGQLDNKSLSKFLERIAAWEIEALNSTQNTPAIFRHRLLNNYLNSENLPIIKYHEFRSFWYEDNEYPAPTLPLIEEISPKIVTLPTITEISRNYLFGIQWILEYYLNGSRNLNLTWYYPRLYAPLFSDMAKVAKIDIIPPPTGFYQFIHPLEQLLMVFSPRERFLFPQVLLEAFSKQKSIPWELDLQINIYDYFCLDRGYLSERKCGLAIIPFVDPHMLHEFFISLKIPKEILDVYLESSITITNPPTLLPLSYSGTDLDRIKKWKERPKLL
jgi:5'-3' exonuclease